MKILILNPPSSDAHLRGNYCSNVSKGVYYYPAIDLLVQSGVLSAGFDVSVCDAIADRKSEEDVLSEAAASGYGGVYAVTGSSSRVSDLAFFRKLKERVPGIRILLTGGYLLTQHEKVFAEAPWIDGALLDWASGESAAFFRGETGPFHDIALPGFPRTVSKTPMNKVMRYPVPRHDLFPVRRYNHPHARSHPLSVVVHSSGCPYRCDYCIYSVTPYRARPVGDVMEELRFLRSIDVREVFFFDPTFAVVRREAMELLAAMKKENLGIGWFCQSRVDHMDEEILTAMKEAGCHAMMFGVESASEDLLKEHDRKILHGRTKEVYALCAKLGIRTLSYLVIGLPGDTEATIGATVDFVKSIRSDFVSFNLAIPVIGTKFRENLIGEGLASEAMVEFDNSCDDPPMPTRHLTREELSRVHKKALRSFYFRPAYLFQRLTSIRSFYELKNQIREGFSLVKRFG